MSSIALIGVRQVVETGDWMIGWTRRLYLPTYFNAVLGNLFGVVLTPALLLLLVGRTGYDTIRYDKLRLSSGRPLSGLGPGPSPPHPK